MMEKRLYILLIVLLGAVLFSGCVANSGTVPTVFVNGTVSPGSLDITSLNYHGRIIVTNTGNQPVEFEEIIGGFYTKGEGMQTTFSRPGGEIWKLSPGESASLSFESKEYALLERASLQSGYKIRFSLMIIKNGEPLNGKIYTADVPYMSQILSENSGKIPLNFEVSDATAKQ